jgi:tRNA threonylcarbamoyl adenosine modification protein (Sua5/YciO/YrdC/YwlC family)
MAELIKIYPENPHPRAIEKVVKSLKNGGLVIYPTDTVYNFILPSNKALPRPFKKRKTVGVRIPKHAVILEIVKQLGNPILTTSIHDEDAIIEYTTDPDIIFDDWRSQVDIVIDSGFWGNIPSTVIDACQEPPVVIRSGAGEFN